MSLKTKIFLGLFVTLMMCYMWTENLLAQNSHKEILEVLPKPVYENTFYITIINEAFNFPSTSTKTMFNDAKELLDQFGPQRLYSRIGFSAISDPGRRPMEETIALAKKAGIPFVFSFSMQSHSIFGKLREVVEKDRRNAQWRENGDIKGSGKGGRTGKQATLSRLAKDVVAVRKAYARQWAEEFFKVMKKYPYTAIAMSGPIEEEYSEAPYDWGDYSPYSIAEFRDWLRHRGIYDNRTGEFKGEGWPGGEQFADDPTPADNNGTGKSFNEVFGTKFTTWRLKYWDLDKYPVPLANNANPMPKKGKGYISGGFDAPRVRKPGNSFWDVWDQSSTRGGGRGFRQIMINNWVKDELRWMTEVGIPADRLFSHQIPGEYISPERLFTSGSPLWTADVEPYGGVGITAFGSLTWDVPWFQGGQPLLFKSITVLDKNWGIFEYHPQPGATTVDYLGAYFKEGKTPPPLLNYNICMKALKTSYPYRPHILAPGWWNDTTTFIVNNSVFAKAIKDFRAGLPDQPYYNKKVVNYEPPVVTGLKVRLKEDNKAEITWSELMWADVPYAKWSIWRGFSKGYFLVYRAEKEGEIGKFIGETTSYQFIDKDLEAGKEYYYSVVAVKNNGLKGKESPYKGTK